MFAAALLCCAFQQAPPASALPDAGFGGAVAAGDRLLIYAVEETADVRVRALTAAEAAERDAAASATDDEQAAALEKLRGVLADCDVDLPAGATGFAIFGAVNEVREQLRDAGPREFRVGPRGPEPTVGGAGDDGAGSGDGAEIEDGRAWATADPVRFERLVSTAAGVRRRGPRAPAPPIDAVVLSTAGGVLTVRAGASVRHYPAARVARVDESPDRYAARTGFAPEPPPAGGGGVEN